MRKDEEYVGGRVVRKDVKRRRRNGRAEVDGQCKYILDG